MLKRLSLLVLAIPLLASCSELELSPQPAADEAVATVEQAVTRDPMPNRLHLADVDGDGVSELLQVAGNKLFAFAADWPATGRYHLYTATKIQRVISGNFTGQGRQNLALVLEGNMLVVHDLATRLAVPAVDPYSLASIGKQANFIGADEQAIVGAFDGSGRDNLLVYSPSTGRVRLYFYDTSAGRFDAVPNFILGNLNGVGTGLRFFAGRFRADSPRDHLVVLRPGGQISTFDAVTDGAGKVTFWWAFTTYGGQVAGVEVVLVANVTGARASLVLHSRTTGRNRMLERELVSNSNFSLRPVVGVDQGQIDQTAAGTQLVFAKLKSSSELGASREDTLLFYPNGSFARVDARYSGTALTYWWAFTKGLPQLHQAWPESRAPQWVALKCKFKDTTAEPAPFATLVLGAFLSPFGENTGNVYDYYRDTTYGGILLTNTRVEPAWFTMALTLAQAKQKYADAIAAGGHYRGGMIQDCVAAARASGVSIPEGAHVVAYMNTPIDIGSDGWNVLADPALPTSYDHGFMTHEMGHTNGRPDNFGDETSGPFCNSGRPGIYCDPWDTMGDGYSYQTSGAHGRAAPGFGALNLYRMGVLPEHRIVTLVPEPTRRLTSVTLAALTRPEVNAPLAVRIGIPGVPMSSRFLVVELRQKAGWDRNIPQDAVIVREQRADGLSYLLTNLGGPQRLPGWGYSGTHEGRLISVAVRSFDAATSTAQLDITY